MSLGHPLWTTSHLPPALYSPFLRFLMFLLPPIFTAMMLCQNPRSQVTDWALNPERKQDHLFWVTSLVPTMKTLTKGTFCLLPVLQSSKPYWGKHLAIHFCTNTVNNHIWNQCEYNSILSFSTPRKYYTMPNVVAHICNCSTEKVEAGESEIADQSMLDSFILSQKKTH